MSMKNKSFGFTIVELSAVIVVIGILATIVIVSYDGLTKKAYDNKLQSNVDKMADAQDIYSARNLASAGKAYYYSGTGDGYDADLDFRPSEGNVLDVVVNADGYCIRGYNSKSSKNTLSNAMIAESREGACQSLSPSTLALSSSGLAMYLDASYEDSLKGRTSVINWETWVAGAVGNATNYSQNGDGNSRIYDSNPWGNLDVVWDVSNGDAASDADGGWNGTSFSVDRNKKYRFSVFVRRKVVGDGRFYMGLGGGGGGVVNRSNNVQNTNPYFTAPLWWGSANQWYLVTGHVWPSGSGTGSNDPESGAYSMDGTKLFNSGDFVWLPTTTSSYHRSYMYYSINPTTNQQFYQPRVDVVDGTEPTISELLNDAGNTWCDLSGNNNNARLINNVGYRTDNGGALKFDGVDDYVNIPTQPLTSVTPNNFTIAGFINPDNQASKIITPQSNGIDQYIGYEPSTQNIHVAVAQQADINTRFFETPNNSVLLNKWTHFAVSINDKNIKIYINGNKVVEKNETIDIAGWSSNWFIGQRGGNAYWYKGLLGSLSLFNRELTGDEVKANFDGQKARFGL